MEIENKLDEDFLFYLGFIKSGAEKFKDDEEQYNICQAWLQRLCGETAKTVEQKRNRNIYLSQLVLCMEEYNLSGPFEKLPPCKLPIAKKIFGPRIPEIKEPAWMSEIASKVDEAPSEVRDTRTYFSTKALPNGKGAMGFLAISFEDGILEKKGEGFDEHMERKFQELVPPLSEMERILINRKIPEERQKVIDFYNLILQNVAKEIDGIIPPGSNAHTAGLINQLINNLKSKGEYCQYECMEAEQQRIELLFLLDSKLKERIMHIKNREDFLDIIEKDQMNSSFFDTSLYPEDIHKEDKGSRASKMWTQAINAGPSHKLINELSGRYPSFIIKKYLELLANTKEQIALKIQRRHENVFSQLKKELRKEGEKGKRKVEKTKLSHDEINEIKEAVMAAENKCYESYKRKEDYMTGKTKESDELYEHVRNAVLETQQHVEEEAIFGRYLSKQINTVVAQSETFQQVNEESIKKMEEDNMTIIKNIQRLTKIIKQHEGRIKSMKEALAKSNVESGSKFFVA